VQSGYRRSIESGSLRNWSRRPFTIVHAGGFALICGAAAFMVVFSYLAVRFSYPEILDGVADDVLPRLLATGAEGRFVWTVYGFLPLLWIPAGAGAYRALRLGNEGAMRVAMLLATVSAVAMMLGLLRWPSLHWALAEAYASDDTAGRATISAIFAAFNSYLGNFIGEFLGELSLNLFFLISAGAMLPRRSGFPRALGLFGILAACTGLIGMFRNAVDAVAPVAELNNYLLPLWMLAFGIGLLRSHGVHPASPIPAHPGRTVPVVTP
jgi:hypothetical protein